MKTRAGAEAVERWSKRIARRPRPDCGHKLLMECPLTTADWGEVLNAYAAFMFQCRLISEQAHARASETRKLIDNDVPCNPR